MKYDRASWMQFRIGVENMTQETYRRRRLSILGQIAELRHIHNSDERHWHRAVAQRALADLRAVS